MSTPSHVDLTVDQGVARITLCHPSKPNPLTQALQQELLQALRSLAADEGVHALVLTASGRAFCVGADLDEMKQAQATHPSLGAWTSDFMQALTNPIVLALRDLPFPVVCAVNGAAAGAGVGLALAGDLTLMARSSYLYLPFVPRLGIVPDMGSTWFLPRLVGRQRATALALLGNRLGAEQAVDWGVAWACMDDDRLGEEAAALARQLARTPPGAARELRRALDASASHTLDAQLDDERQRQRRLIDGPAFREGMLAFLERREPDFHREPGGGDTA